ncbi:hypothetical protein [cf. Phormidesmis sp. LEGE 11477]|uniref:hypothetical protein n=1 Tax=cf. Phormidesmis sp. LEGE 11477 TaxID=1828680 RepID=UPI00187F9965|nr:hypothetical protein [cf. Phormidesmis sp. LEGE 11477]MBE9061155.1 hypothetical protein [cf. Phormidesmis sp. LEGE 11477]
MTPSSALPTESNHFKAYYQPWIGILLLGVGLAICVLSIGSMLQSGSFNSAIILGSGLAIAGYLYFTRPYFTLAPNRLTIYNLLGKVVKRYPFETFNKLSVENGTLYVKSSFLEGDRPEPTKLKKWLVKSKDWKRLQETIDIALEIRTSDETSFDRDHP